MKQLGSQKISASRSPSKVEQQNENVLQPLIQNAYSPQTSYLDNIAVNISADAHNAGDVNSGDISRGISHQNPSVNPINELNESKDMSSRPKVQGYVVRDTDNLSTRKQLALGYWRQLIHAESDKVNSFYLNIQRQLLLDYGMWFGFQSFECFMKYSVSFVILFGFCYRTDSEKNGKNA